mgnify:CR=1 FL=1
MLKPISYTVLGATGSFMTSAYYGVGFGESLLVGILAGNASLIVWAVGYYIADRHFRPAVDAATMGKGVCPACRTFNSLEEVTSADPNARCAHCLACGERYSVTVEHERLVAERLGKFED